MYIYIVYKKSVLLKLHRNRHPVRVAMVPQSPIISMVARMEGRLYCGRHCKSSRNTNLQALSLIGPLMPEAVDMTSYS